MDKYTFNITDLVKEIEKRVRVNTYGDSLPFFDFLGIGFRFKHTNLLKIREWLYLNVISFIYNDTIVDYRDLLKSLNLPDSLVKDICSSIRVNLSNVPYLSQLRSINGVNENGDKLLISLDKNLVVIE